MAKKLWLGSIGILACFLLYFFLPDYIPEVGKRVTAVFLFALVFWAFEIIPLYATSLLIILLLTFLLSSPIDRLGEGLHFFLLPFSSPVIMLFLGGLTLAAAAAKHGVDQFFLEKMVSRLGGKSHRLVIGLLFISALFSLWISNTAAAAMLLILIKPILAQIEEDDPLRKGAVLAVAFGASIGGLGTPIGSPPNAIAIGILDEHGIQLDFLSWMVMAVPLAICLLLIAAVVLLFFFRPKSRMIPFKIEKTSVLKKKGWGVLAVGAVMVLAWLTKPLHGISEGIVGLSGVGLLAAFQLISAKDIRQIPWDLLILMWGGLALGEAVASSELITNALAGTPLLLHSFVLIAGFCLLAMFLTSVISNTATANLLLPIALSIDPSGQNLLPITVALACSFSLAFPISTPPNTLVYGTGMVATRDMSKSGAVISLLSLIIMLLGFKIVIPWAFRL